MSDKFFGGIKTGSTSVTIDVLLRKKADSTEYTGVVYNLAGLSAAYRRQGSAPVAITLATQTVGGAWSSGGFIELDAAKCPGLYRLDVPDAAFAAGVDYVTITVVSILGFTYTERIALSSDVIQTGDTYALANNGTYGFAMLARRADLPANLSALAITAGGVIDVSLKWILGGALTETVAGYLTAGFKKFFNVAAPTSTMNQITLVDTATNVTNTPTNGDFTNTQKASITAAVPTAGAIAIAVESAILNESDGQQVLQAIVDKINATDTNLAGLTLGAIAQAVRDVALAGAAAGGLGAGVTTVMTTGALEANEITRSNALSAKLDTLLTRNNALDANGVRAAVGLALANLDAQLAAIAAKTTNLPPDPADASDIAALVGGLSATIRAQADAALAAYDAPTHAEMTAELASADDAVLAALGAGVNVTRINGVALVGAGTPANPMRPA